MSDTHNNNGKPPIKRQQRQAVEAVQIYSTPPMMLFI